MKVTVLKPYVDKNTREFHKAGVELEYADERAQELAENGFVALKAEPKPKVEKKATTKKSTAKKPKAKK